MLTHDVSLLYRSIHAQFKKKVQITSLKLITYFNMGTTGVSWALLVYMQNCQPTLLVL